MKWIFKILGLLAVWSIPVGIVVFVDPALIKDVLIPGSYLPFLVAIFFAVLYTSLIIFKKRKWLALIVAVLLTLSLILSILSMLYWFVILAIVLLLLSVCYIHFSG